MRPARLLASGLVLLVVLSSVQAQTLPTTNAPVPGHRVSFPLTKYEDTLFASVTAAYRVRFDDNGDVWYSTEAGVVHLDLQGKTRELYTHEEGLPSSLAMGLAVQGGKVYVGTDLGLAVIDRSTHKVVTQVRSDNSQIPDDIIHEVVLDGNDVLMGTHFAGMVRWDPSANTFVAKNTSTTPDYPKPVRRIVTTPESIWVGTDGDGAWRYDRASGNWSVLLKSDGLPSNSVLGIAQAPDGSVWLGTDAGLAKWREGKVVRTWNATTDGMPSDRVWDVDFIPRAGASGVDAWIATEAGMWQYDPDTGANQTRAQDWGLMGSLVWDDAYNDITSSWAFGTELGVSLANSTGWTYYSTGPTNGPSPGPLHYRFTAVAAADGLVWSGNELGVSAFRPAGAGDDPTQARGVWYNLGEWQAYPGGQVNAIKRQGNVTWFGTSKEAVGYDSTTNSWIERKVTGSRNIVYGLDAQQGEVWIGLFGDGLIMQNLTTNLTRSWNYQTTPTPIPDQYVTDVKIDGNTVWLGASVGVIRMDRVTGEFKGTYTGADGIPSGGVTFRVLPDGPVVYVGTKDGGVARLNVASGKVDKVWNDTAYPGFPMSEVRDLYREGGRLWVGTKDGLARINVTTGDVTVWNQSNSRLVQNFVNGITSQDGILYLATSSGIARMDIATGAFLPMRDGPGAQIGTGGGATHTQFDQSPIVRIDSPKDGSGVTGIVDIKGVASKLGGAIDRVEVQIGDGPWQVANGTTSWSLRWDTAGATPDRQLTIKAHALSGNESSHDADVLVTPVKLPTIPLTIEHNPVRSISAGRPLLVAATVFGDEPLSATLYYRLPGRDAFDKLAMQRQSNEFSATIAGRSVVQGAIQYYVVANSGLLSATSPDDPGQPWVVSVGPPARVAVAIEGPAALTAEAGRVTPLVLNVTNVGTDAATYKITGSGLRASWLAVPGDALTLQPNETRQVNATLNVPILAFADNTTLRFDVVDVNGAAQPAEASVPVQVLAAPPTSPTGDAQPTPKSAVPLPPIVALAAVALAALVLSRRRRA